MKAINIKWDTDGDLELLQELPKEIEIPKDMADEDEFLTTFQMLLDFATMVLIWKKKG